LTAKVKAIGTERAVSIANAAEVAGDVLVVADLMAGGATQVVAEVTKTGMELLEDDSLRLNFTNLLSDDTLGHLLQYKQTLLDDLDSLSVANYLLSRLDLLREVGGAIEVIDTIEVVEVVKR